MIYLLTEHVMNGIVTAGILSTGIEADSFDAAFGKLTHFENWGQAVDVTKDDMQVSYTIPGSSGGFGVWGLMKNEPLRVR